ncbi:unnamed protein product, partial [Mesorhabditis belari]|uniref:BBSome-interacting protein 1 n=1 Tax=Mesorhabditis belari TaxID=2138241 RepID=A0AAF3F177_9BILA
MSPIFCKPKLIPLKTITMEKLEKMQQDAIEKLKALEEAEEAEQKASKQSNAPEDESKSENETNIWKADE